MRSQRFNRAFLAPVLALLVAAANATPASAGDDNDPAMLAGAGLLLISGTFAIANSEAVLSKRGNVLLGTMGILTGAPTAGIGALALVRNLDTDEVSWSGVGMSVALVTVGMAAAILGGESVSLARAPQDDALSLTPTFILNEGTPQPGLLLTRNF